MIARFLVHLLLVLLLAALAASGWIVGTSDDPIYAAQELISFGRHSSQDALIAEAARKTGVEPALIKALIWRESAFHPDKMGAAGERGLMQVGEAAATDWARAEKLQTFMPPDLFEPRTNVEAGTWYLRRALEKWKDRDDPVPFALAEYNAGPSRLERWVDATAFGAKADSLDLMTSIDFPSTRRYIDDIMARAKFYRARGGR